MLTNHPKTCSLLSSNIHTHKWELKIPNTVHLNDFEQHSFEITSTNKQSLWCLLVCLCTNGYKFYFFSPSVLSRKTTSVWFQHNSLSPSLSKNYPNPPVTQMYLQHNVLNWFTFVIIFLFWLMHVVTGLSQQPLEFYFCWVRANSTISKLKQVLESATLNSNSFFPGCLFLLFNITKL